MTVNTVKTESQGECPAPAVLTAPSPRLGALGPQEPKCTASKHIVQQPETKGQDQVHAHPETSTPVAENLTYGNSKQQTLLPHTQQHRGPSKVAHAQPRVSLDRKIMKTKSWSPTSLLPRAQTLREVWLTSKPRRACVLPCERRAARRHVKHRLTVRPRNHEAERTVRHRVLQRCDVPAALALEPKSQPCAFHVDGHQSRREGAQE